MKKVLNTIKKIVITILAVIFFSFVIFITILLLNFNDYGVTQFDGTSLIIIRDKISAEEYKKGDLVIVEKKELEEIAPGDEMFVYKLDNKGKVKVDIGIIGEIHSADNAVSFENGATFDMDFVAGASTKVYNDIGGYLSLIQSTWGFLFIILIPSFLIFIYELYALIVEIKYGKEVE